jgi:hypothetical protein
MFERTQILYVYLFYNWQVLLYIFRYSRYSPSLHSLVWIVLIINGKVNLVRIFPNILNLLCHFLGACVNLVRVFVIKKPSGLDDRVSFFVNDGDLYVEFAFKKAANFCLNDRFRHAWKSLYNYQCISNHQLLI